VVATAEGFIAGLLLGVVDVHSAGGWIELAYLSTGVILGIRHAAAGWMALIPLGTSLFFAHETAIAWGYEPPYVEKNALRAIICLPIATVASAIGLLIGIGLRHVFSFIAGESDRN
jgi:hypothetical protein